MKTHVLPPIWDAAKFAIRYGLNALANDFFVGGDGRLHYPDSLPDEPIFEAPDPPAIRQTKWTAGVSSKQPAGYLEIARGKFIPYYD